MSRTVRSPPVPSGLAAGRYRVVAAWGECQAAPALTSVIGLTALLTWAEPWPGGPPPLNLPPHGYGSIRPLPSGSVARPSGCHGMAECLGYPGTEDGLSPGFNQEIDPAGPPGRPAEGPGPW